MHIAIDARAYSWTGIGRYIRNLLGELVKIESEHSFVILASHNEIPLIRSEAGADTDRVSFHGVEPSYYSLKEQTTFLWQLNTIQADLFHFTHFNVPVLFRKPFVVTIHDTTRFVFPGQKRQRLIQQIGYEYIFANAVTHARAVLCVSEFTRSQLYKLPISYIPTTHVVYEGVDNLFFRELRREDRQKVRMLLGTRGDYILYVGVWMSHKNLVRLLQAFRIAHRKRPDLKLVITGKPVPGYINAMKIAQDLAIDDYVLFPGYVPQPLLPALYAEAQCFVFPSLYEGFGLPPLEAAACGTPVLTSNVSSMPEIMRDAALYINPEDVEGIAHGLLKILEDNQLRETLIRRGSVQARNYNWSAACRQHMSVYESAVHCEG